MKRGLGLVGTAMTGAAMLFWFASSSAGASHAGPPQYRPVGGKTAIPVAEPSTIALLGAGLIALGVYAKRKNHKRS
jgi:PEP-CTERM motif